MQSLDKMRKLKTLEIEHSRSKRAREGEQETYLLVEGDKTLLKLVQIESNLALKRDRLSRSGRDQEAFNFSLSSSTLTRDRLKSVPDD